MVNSAAEKFATGAPEDEIEITPAMIEAGLGEFSPKTIVDLAESWADPVMVVESVYRAMLLAARE